MIYPLSLWALPLTILDLRVRYHEAGHAAVALRQGFTLEEVSVVVDGVSRGRVTVKSHPAGNASPHAFWDKLVMTLAGSVAEEAFLGGYEPRGARMDLVHAKQIAEALQAKQYAPAGASKPLSVEQLLTRAQTECRGIMLDSLSDVVQLAHALGRRRKLTGAEAGRVVSEAAAPGLCQSV